LTYARELPSGASNALLISDGHKRARIGILMEGAAIVKREGKGVIYRVVGKTLSAFLWDSFLQERCTVGEMMFTLGYTNK
jgi:hypothetical protein